MIPQEPKKDNKTCPILTKMNIDDQKIYIFLHYFVKSGQHKPMQIPKKDTGP